MPPQSVDTIGKVFKLLLYHNGTKVGIRATRALLEVRIEPIKEDPVPQHTVLWF